jgi:hypothetical protein
MDVQTSLNFLRERELRINLLLENSDLTIQMLIKICLKKLAPMIRKQGFQLGTLSYQPVTNSYFPLPFEMSFSEYDIYMDLKKVSKFTLSLLVAIALDLFAEKILNSNAGHDSYLNSKYFVGFYIYKNMPLYIFSWEEEVEHEKTRYRQIE